ncbi:UNVERIFIED_CONTAM: hypothetical protein FKN15_078358 [Acipenser sinensis]
MEDQVLQLQGRFRVVYMTPEFCSGGTSLLQQLDKNIGITLVAVDEAHCISEWGHDFRGAYRKLGSLKRVLPNVPIVALTATASPSIRQDIVNSLHLDNPQITCTSFDRPNLFLDVHRKCGNITQDLKQFLIKKKSFDYEFEGPAIVYCPSRKVTEQVSAELSKLGINCATYHAGMGIKPRRETHHKFMRDEIQCVVATVAFGMGINKADIRKVIHYGAPKEMEAYYQEIGRAGRDGLPSACHVVWGSGDMALNRQLLSGVKSDNFRGYKMKMMAKMEKYLSSPKCRRKIILSHFEDKQLRKASLGIMGTDKCCDNCSSRLLYDPSADDTESNLQDFGKEAYQLMSAVTALGEKFGTAVPVLFLRGSYSQRLPDRFRKLPLFGCGRNIPETWWKALGRQLITEGYMKENSRQNKFAITCGLDQKCVVATVAFGMGINKADIRKVIHYGAPKEMEAYYQEIGRAGRDGLPSACHVVWGSGDMALNRQLLSGVKSDNFRGYKMKMMAKMEKYLSSPKCRRKIILSHFKDKQLRKASLGIMGTDKCCDNCSSRLLYDPSADDTESNLQDFGKEAYQLMSAVTALGEKFGTAVPVLFLRGSYSQRLPDRFRKLPLFGCGRNIPETWWKALGRQLITEGYMKENSRQNKFAITCGLDQKGRTWLSKANDESHRTLLLQPNTELCARFFTVPNRYQAPSSAALPASSSTHPSGTEPPGVLYGKLVAGRQKLANEKDVPPAVLATNKILLDLAKIRPTTVENMKRVDGVSEAKSSMLAPLLVVISEFCQSEDLEANTFSSPSGGIERKCPPGMSSSCSALPDSVRITYNLFQQQGLSLRKVADSRSLPVSVVGSHLSQALKIGYPLDTERAGLTPQTQRKITDIIRSSPINSDLSRQKAIRDLVPQDIESYLISLTIALLQKQTGSGQPGQQSTGQSGPKQGPSNSVSRQQKLVTVKEEALTWIEAEEKPVKKSAPPSLMTKCQPGQGYADEIEDDLLSDMPMPVRAENPVKKSAPPSLMTKCQPGQGYADEIEDDLLSDMPMPVRASHSYTEVSCILCVIPESQLHRGIMYPLCSPRVTAAQRYHVSFV